MYTIEINLFTCKNCGKGHDGSFSDKRFCSSECLNKFTSKHKTENKLKHKKSSKYKYKNASNTGKIAELAITKKFLEYNIIPYNTKLNNGVDIVIKIGNTYIPIQVIASSRVSGKYHNIVRFSLTNHISRSINNSESIVRFDVKPPEYKIHYFALYDIDEGEIYLIKNKNLGKNIMLHRNMPEDNNNPIYKYANDYKFDNVIKNIIDEYK